MKHIRTDLMDIGVEHGGPANGAPVILLHGWPDAPRGWEPLARRLEANGHRTIIPFLRGSGPTQFLSKQTPRVGAAVALAQDTIDLADALGIERFAVVGHDWGARVAYTLAALFPERITKIAALALGYQPHGTWKTPSFEQSRRFWYQWFVCTDGGSEAVRKDPIGFARIQWGTWSPSGWFDDAEFERTAESFKNPDWAAITLNAYRSRWRQSEECDPRYDTLQRRLGEVEKIDIPTLMIQGLEDYCDPPSESEGLEEFFTRGYRRVVVENIGHFPQREAPDLLAEIVLEHLQESTKPKA